MKITHLVAAFTAFALLGSVEAGDLESGLARMVSTTGDAYVAARDAVVAHGESARPALEAKVNGAWTQESFPTLAAAAIALAHITHPDLAKRLEHVEGVDASIYLKRRRPEPECGHEIKQLGPDAVGFLLERYLKTFDRYTFTTAESLPKGSLQDPEKLASEERIALRQAIVYAIAESHHASALFVCRAVARDANEVEPARLRAAEGLGTQGTAAALAELVSLEGDASTPASVKLAAIRGVGRVPAAEALAFLQGRLAGSADERRAAVSAIGAFGSYLGWQARGAALTETGGKLRASASAALVSIVCSAEPGVDEEVLLQALATIAHPSSRDALVKAQANESLTPAARARAGKALERVNMSLERQGK
jgi:hypothetical protein